MTVKRNIQIHLIVKRKEIARRRHPERLLPFKDAMTGNYYFAVNRKKSLCLDR
jgi:hypothetical protein